MKIFLNVIGILAMLSGPLALFAGDSIEARVAGGIVLLVAVTALGLAKLVELGEAEAKAAKAHRALEVEYWKFAVSRSATNAEGASASQPCAAVLA